MRTLWLCGACFALASLCGVAQADVPVGPTPWQMRLRQRAIYRFTAPAGFTGVMPADGPPDPSVFDAASTSPLATMHATYTAGARAINQAALDDESNKLVTDYPTAHPGFTAKIIKKEMLTVSGAPVARLVLEGEPVPSKHRSKKKQPLPREVHYYFGNGSTQGEIVYTCDSAAFTKLEPLFDASMRATQGLAPVAAAAATH